MNDNWEHAAFPPEAREDNRYSERQAQVHQSNHRTEPEESTGNEDPEKQMGKPEQRATDDANQAGERDTLLNPHATKQEESSQEDNVCLRILKGLGFFLQRPTETEGVTTRSMQKKRKTERGDKGDNEPGTRDQECSKSEDTMKDQGPDGFSSSVDHRETNVGEGNNDTVRCKPGTKNQGSGDRGFKHDMRKATIASLEERLKSSDLEPDEKAKNARQLADLLYEDAVIKRRRLQQKKTNKEDVEDITEKSIQAMKHYSCAIKNCASFDSKWKEQLDLAVRQCVRETIHWRFQVSPTNIADSTLRIINSLPDSRIRATAYENYARMLQHLSQEIFSVEMGKHGTNMDQMKIKDGLGYLTVGQPYIKWAKQTNESKTLDRLERSYEDTTLIGECLQRISEVPGHIKAFQAEQEMDESFGDEIADKLHGLLNRITGKHTRIETMIMYWQAEVYSKIYKDEQRATDCRIKAADMAVSLGVNNNSIYDECARLLHPGDKMETTQSCGEASSSNKDVNEKENGRSSIACSIC